MRVVSGLALPLNAKYENDVIYTSETKLIYETPIPLLLNHDIAKRIGRVIAFVQKSDGLYYVAEVDDTLEESKDFVDTSENYAVSIGGRFDRLTNTLLVYELSVTPSPYFETSLELVLSNTNKNTKNLVEYSMSTTEVKAQDLATIEQVLSEHEAAIAEIKTMLQELMTNVQALSERVATLETSLTQVSETAASKVEEQVSALVQASTQKIVSDLDSFLSKTVAQLFTNLNALIPQK